MLSERKSSFFGRTSPHKERGMGVIIPNIPKLIDEKARVKLLCDYDKYEQELFKHHIGTPDTTRTIGLKHVPEDFDRHVPSGNEPTLAERDWESRKGYQKSLKQLTMSLGLKAGLQKRNAADTQTAVRTTEAWQTVSMREPTGTAHNSVPPSEHIQPHTLPRQRSLRAVKETSKPLPLVTIETEKQDLEVPPTATTVPVKPTVPGRPQPKVSSPRSLKLRSPDEKQKVSREIMRSMLSSVPQQATRVSATSSTGLQLASCDDTWDATHCGRLLGVLLNTPPEYSESFNLELRNIDLEWMRGKRYPGALITLYTWHSGEVGANVPAINSPRSALVLLRNGITVKDLIPDISTYAASLPQNSESRQMVKQMRLRRTTQRCEELLQRLRDEYTELCRRVNLADVLNAFQSQEKRENTVELPTSIRIDYERRQRNLERERKRFEKELAYAKEVRERQLIAEERQQQLEEEAKMKVAMKKEEDRVARERAAERLAAQRRKRAELEAFYLKGLQERQARADEMNARRIEAQQRLIERRREDRLRLAEERQRRFHSVAEKQEEQRQHIMQKYKEGEERVQRLKEEQERRRQALQASIMEKAAKSVELRELARQRAAMHEEKVRQAAIEQQQKVEERLARFHQECEEVRLQRAQQEEAKRARRREMFNEAVNKLNAFKEEVAEKQLQHEKNYEEIQQRRQMEMLMRLEQDHEDMEKKSFAVLRKKRMTEFEKLEVVLQLLSKRETATFIENQRKLLLDETRKTREAMSLERDILKEEVARQKELTH